jgi:uncharacterized protein GlcG (DUF336 family)
MLNESQTQSVLNRAVAKASALGQKLSIAIVDEGGYLKGFIRMEGAPLFSVNVAQGKAYSVIFMGRTSEALKEFADARPNMFGAIRDQGLHPLIPSPGGIALPGGGAIGVSGAPDPKIDVAVAQEAISEL